VNQQIQVGTGGATVAQAMAYVDAALANNQWLILTFHDIKDVPTQGADSYDYATADLDAIAAYVKEKGIAVTNITDGLASGTNNLLANGTFNNGLADGWTTDDAANIKADADNNGRYPDPTNSIAIASHTGANPGSSNGKSHLYSPMVNVNPSDKYLIQSYLNLTSITANEVAFFIDEYDANGTWISGQLKPGISYKAEANAIHVSDVSFEYLPSSATVAKASLQVIVPNDSGIQGYFDGAQWYSTSEIANPADTTAPVITAAVEPNAAYIAWKTDEPFVSAKVEYGATTAYGTEVSYSLLGNEYISPLGNLAPGNYYYRITATDAAGNVGTKTGEFTIPNGTNPKTGDANSDGFVDALDYSTVLSNWGTGTTKDKGDVNGDTVVDALDLSTVLSNWGK
jgi:hypothetical protein